MKEKIKNFLLKIKKSLCTEIKTPVYKIMLFGILMIILSSICFGCSHYVNETFNDIKSEQIEETPQVELNKIDRDINRYGYNYDNSITFGGTPIIADSPFTNFYFNTALKDGYVEERVSTLTDYMLFVEEAGLYMYPLFSINNSNETHYLSCILLYMLMPTDNNSDLFTPLVFIYFEDDVQDQYPIYATDGAQFGLDGVNGFALSQQSFGFGYVYQQIRAQNLDYIYEAGIYNEHFSWLVSRTPYTISSIGSNIPQLENAPSSLVNTIPSNAVTSLPNNLGTKVYDSGSGVTITESGNEYNTFGFQVYYKSNITYSESELYRFTIDGITYDVEPYVYRYYLNDVNVVIYTLWNNTPIYYVFENLLMGGDWPFTLDYETRFNFTDLSNMFASSVYIVDTYNDYIHINIEFSYLMTLVYDGDTEYLIDTDETGLNALIYSTTHQGNYSDKGFDLDIIPQLDKNYSKMGVSQTNNMYSTIVHGGTINQVWSNAYHKGIGVGETTGYSNGYNDGIETGKTLQNPINPIMDFISDGANVISNVFDTKIFPGVTDDSPGITLGTMLLFPLAISLIWFAIKLFMGG